MLRDWIPARAWPVADRALAAAGRTRFQPVSSWQHAEQLTCGYEEVSRSQTRHRRSPRPLRPTLFDGRDLQVLAALATVLGSTARAEISVLDFGGGDGRYADAVRRVIPARQWRWTVVETPAVVQLFGSGDDHHTRWVTNMGDVGSADVVLASGALNVVPDPYGVLRRLVSVAPYLILNRLPLWPILDDNVACQLPTKRRGFGYPTWFFSESRFKAEVTSVGRVLMEWEVPQDSAFFAGSRHSYRGLLVESASRS